MNKRAIRIGISAVVGLGIIVGGIWLLAWTLGNGQKYYHGKTLSQWATELHSPDSEVHAQAANDVEKFVVPPLIDAMLHDTNDSHLKLTLAQFLNKLPGIAIPLAPAADRRHNAAQILGQLGPPAKSATPALIQALKSNDDAVRSAAATALGNLHEQPDVVIPLLISSLGSSDLTQNAATALGEFGPLAKGAVSNLVALLKVPNQDNHVRNAALGALNKIDPENFSKAAATGRL